MVALSQSLTLEVVLTLLSVDLIRHEIERFGAARGHGNGDSALEILHQLLGFLPVQLPSFVHGDQDVVAGLDVREAIAAVEIGLVAADRIAFVMRQGGDEQNESPRRGLACALRDTFDGESAAA